MYSLFLDDLDSLSIWKYIPVEKYSFSDFMTIFFTIRDAFVFEVVRV